MKLKAGWAIATTTTTGATAAGRVRGLAPRIHLFTVAIYLV